MKNRWMWAIALSAAVGSASADNLCRVNPYTKAEAEQGRIAFESHCALCHQYNMTGRTPGNYMNESPDFSLLSESDLRFLDGGGGSVPPLSYLQVAAYVLYRNCGKM